MELRSNSVVSFRIFVSIVLLLSTSSTLAHALKLFEVSSTEFNVWHQQHCLKSKSTGVIGLFSKSMSLNQSYEMVNAMLRAVSYNPFNTSQPALVWNNFTMMGGGGGNSNENEEERSGETRITEAFLKAKNDEKGTNSAVNSSGGSIAIVPSDPRKPAYVVPSDMWKSEGNVSSSRSRSRNNTMLATLVSKAAAPSILQLSNGGDFNEIDTKGFPLISLTLTTQQDEKSSSVANAAIERYFAQIANMFWAKYVFVVKKVVVVNHGRKKKNNRGNTIPPPPQLSVSRINTNSIKNKSPIEFNFQGIPENAIPLLLEQFLSNPLEYKHLPPLFENQPSVPCDTISTLTPDKHRRRIITEVVEEQPKPRHKRRSRRCGCPHREEKHLKEEYQERRDRKRNQVGKKHRRDNHDNSDDKNYGGDKRIATNNIQRRRRKKHGGSEVEGGNNDGMRVSTPRQDDKSTRKSSIDATSSTSNDGYDEKPRNSSSERYPLPNVVTMTPHPSPANPHSYYSVQQQRERNKKTTISLYEGAPSPSLSWFRQVTAAADAAASSAPLPPLRVTEAAQQHRSSNGKYRHASNKGLIPSGDTEHQRGVEDEKEEEVKHVEEKREEDNHSILSSEQQQTTKEEKKATRTILDDLTHHGVMLGPTRYNRFARTIRVENFDITGIMHNRGEDDRLVRLDIRPEITPEKRDKRLVRHDIRPEMYFYDPSQDLMDTIQHSSVLSNLVSKTGMTPSELVATKNPDGSVVWTQDDLTTIALVPLCPRSSSFNTELKKDKSPACTCEDPMSSQFHSKRFRAAETTDGEEVAETTDRKERSHHRSSPPWDGPDPASQSLD